MLDKKKTQYLLAVEGLETVVTISAAHNRYLSSEPTILLSLFQFGVKVDKCLLTFGQTEKDFSALLVVLLLFI